MKLRAVFRTALFAASLALSASPPARAAESLLDRLMSPASVKLLNALRPQLVSQLASTSATPDGTASNSTRFQPTGSRLIVARVVHAMSTDAEAEKTYLESIEEALTAYEQQAVANGVPNDVAAALGLFIAATDLGYRGREMTDAQSDLVVRQLQRALDTPAMRAASSRDKQELYEFLSTFGLYIVLTRQIAISGNNDAALANLKPLAGESLRWLLQVSPDALRLTDSGLRLAPGTITAAATPAAQPVSPVVAAATSGAADASAIVGLWKGFRFAAQYNEARNVYSHEVVAHGTSMDSTVEQIAFLADGWFTTEVWTGPTDPDHPARAKAQPYRWGRYTFDGHKGVINFLAGTPTPFAYDNGVLTYNDQKYTSRIGIR